MRTRRIASIGATTLLLIGIVSVAGPAVAVGGDRIGYYDLSGTAPPSQAVPITAAGARAIPLEDLGAETLAGLDVLMAQNGSNNSYSSDFVNATDRIAEAVADGLVYVFHDRLVTPAETVLPGGSTFDIRRDVTSPGSRNIDVLDDTTLVTNGPGGRIDDDSLDDGTHSNHGFAVSGSLPGSARLILGRIDPAQIVTFCYPFGEGAVVYSSIPLDYYLAGSGPPDVAARMQIYAVNIAAWARVGACAGDGGGVFAFCDGAFATIVGSHRDDRIVGTPGPDVIVGLDGDDIISGTTGDDIICGGPGDDVLRGGAGTDRIEGGPGADLIDGGLGVDRVIYTGAPSGVNIDIGTGTASGGDGSDTFGRIENATGSDHGDVIDGNDKPNRLNGREGNDTIDGHGGKDTVDGGLDDDLLAGGGGEIDRVFFGNHPSGVAVDLEAGTATSDFGDDTLSGFERITGSPFADSLSGDAGPNVINGRQGDDVIDGRGGPDVVGGGAGADSCAQDGSDIVFLCP